MDVEQTSKDLITDDLDIEVRQSFFAVLLDQTVKVTLVVCHNYVWKLSSLFEGRVVADHLH